MMLSLTLSCGPREGIASLPMTHVPLGFWTWTRESGIPGTESTEYVDR